MQDVKHPTGVISTPEHGSGELLSPKCNHSHVLFTPPFTAPFCVCVKLWFSAPLNTMTTMIKSSSHLIGVSPDTNNEPTIFIIGRA